MRQGPARTAGRRRASGTPMALALTLTVALAGSLLMAHAAHAAHRPACPRRAAGALALPMKARRQAARAALAAAPSLYRGLNVRGARVVWARFASKAGRRGAEVAFQCGRAVQARTVVVALQFPRELPSSSLSQGVVFVSRFSRGYRVWEVAH
jgi:hypothetical protein